MTSISWSAQISRRAQLGWSTHGHSGVDVNLYAYPHDLAEPLMGGHENTDICDFIKETMLIDLGPVTADLNRRVASSRLSSPRLIRWSRNSKSWHKIDAGDRKGEHLKLKAYSVRLVIRCIQPGS